VHVLKGSLRSYIRESFAFLWFFNIALLFYFFMYYYYYFMKTTWIRLINFHNNIYKCKSNYFETFSVMAVQPNTQDTHLLQWLSYVYTKLIATMIDCALFSHYINTDSFYANKVVQHVLFIIFFRSYFQYKTKKWILN